MGTGRQKCCHEGCEAALPADEEKNIPDGWTVARVEEYGKTTVKAYYLYLCPSHTLASTTKQESLWKEPAA